jgi:protocatechuate 3,4-dioxygenase beta subunit
LWTRKDAVVLTNDAGGWRSPPMPTHADRVQIALTHPDYGGGPGYCAIHQPDLELLRQDEAVVLIESMIAVDGRIVDENGQPIEAARVRAMSGGQYEVTTEADGQFRIWTARGRDTIRIEQPDFAPKIVRIESKPDDKSIDIQLSRGRLLCGRVVDPTGGPIPDAVVKAAGGLWLGQTDAEGYFEWTQAPAETTALTITKPKYGTVTTSLKPADTPHVITLHRKYDPSRIFRRLSDSAWPQREPVGCGQPVVAEPTVKTT